MEEMKLTTEELCKALGKSRKTIHNWREKGLPFHKEGHNVYFVKEEILNWLQKQAQQAKIESDLLDKCFRITMPLKMALEDYKMNVRSYKKRKHLKDAGIVLDKEMNDDLEFYKEQMLKYEDSYDFEKIEAILIVLEQLTQVRPLEVKIIQEQLNKTMEAVKFDNLSESDVTVISQEEYQEQSKAREERSKIRKRGHLKERFFMRLKNLKEDDTLFFEGTKEQLNDLLEEDPEFKKIWEKEVKNRKGHYSIRR